MVQAYIPAVREISSIVSSGNNAAVTTTSNHSYVTNQLVKFLIPREFGMIELDNVDGRVLEASSNTLLVNINVNNFTPFVVPADYYTPAQVIPIGDLNYGFPNLGEIPESLTISGAYRVTN